MSLNRYAAKVDKAQEEIVSGLRKCGYRCELIGKPVDLLVQVSYHRNHWKLLELKTPQKNGKPRKRNDQKDQDKFCEETGTPRVTSLEEALAALK